MAVLPSPSMLRKVLFSFLSLAFIGIILTSGWQYYRLAASLPVLDGQITLEGLRDKALVTSDTLAVPVIQAASREDAFRILGYLSARDRLFQMDLMRRKSAGRLAEVFGPAAVEADQRQRSLRLEHAAAEVSRRLPEKQLMTLKAYAEGVNSFIRAMKTPPFECWLLDYRPELWRIEDSLLVALGMFQTLSWQDHDERMLTVMSKTLPLDLVAFLTPDTDEHTAKLLGNTPSFRPPLPVPVEALAAVIRGAHAENLSGLIKAGDVLPGSNNWAVNRFRTRDGRAILANDMHLKLGVPNIWYRAVLRYAGVNLAGVTLPGVPLLVVGSNGHIAWGFTNVNADLLDLVQLEVNPENPEQYRTPQGWREFAVDNELIRVKKGSDVAIQIKSTIWGPLSPVPLMNQPVAIHWTALEPEAVNLGLLEMDQAKTLESAIQVMNRAGAPPQNVLLADDCGRIAWTYLGVFPRRKGFDGSITLPWSDRLRGWEGYLSPDELPRIIDPPSGFLATANNRMLGTNYPYPIGHNFSPGYRAFRISERLQAMRQATEKELFGLQLDTVSQFYDFYRELALSTLAEGAIVHDPSLREISRYIEAWNGRADVDSKGIGLLAQFRLDLAQTVLAPLLSRCRQADPDFFYQWHMMDVPLRALLKTKIPRVLPDLRYKSWDELIVSVLKSSAATLKRLYAVESLDELDWGRINRTRLRHPVSRAMPVLGRLLDMQTEDLAGCESCVRVANRDFGASERMVVSPKWSADGILQMPGGQSGHPLSKHYRDQQADWVNGTPLSFAPALLEHTLSFLPAYR